MQDGAWTPKRPTSLWAVAPFVVAAFSISDCGGRPGVITDLATATATPPATSTFRYYNDGTGAWTTIKSVPEGDKLTLSTDTSPGSPLLYRVGRMSARPSSVGINGRTVLVNQSGSLPEMESEGEVNESEGSGWFYDPMARRLIAKVIP